MAGVDDEARFEQGGLGSASEGCMLRVRRAQGKKMLVRVCPKTHNGCERDLPADAKHNLENTQSGDLNWGGGRAWEMLVPSPAKARRVGR